VSFSERDVGRAFKKNLEDQRFFVAYRNETYETGFRVYLNKTVPTYSRKFRNFWLQEGLSPNDIPPPQPEIDMVLEDDRGLMSAIELKLIKRCRQCLKPSYYVGIGQTLAYLSYGFPQVALWLCFDGDSMQDREIFEYNEAFSKIVFPLKQFLATTFFKINKNGDKLRIQERLFEGESSWWEQRIGVQTQHGKNLIRWNSSNHLVSGFQTDRGLTQFDPSISNRARSIYRFLESQREIWRR
jgi:hypothetical protein